MSIPQDIKNTILEWTNEGHEYLYQEEPDRMKSLEQWLDHQPLYLNTPINRRTDWSSIMQAQPGDIITLNRVSSWSGNVEIPNAKYENIDSVLLILDRGLIKGVEISNISSCPEEEEVMLAPARFSVKSRIGDVLYVKYISLP